MAAKTQGAPGSYVWEVPGKPVVVHLHLDVVDRLLSEVMRGFGAVPKRGAEVGGLLIGTIERGEVSIVRIEDFETVECSYKRGPSYLFTDDDRAAFEAACAKWAPNSSNPAYAVGLYRSSTREGFALAEEDTALMDEFFPAPANLALLIKPYGTKVSMGGFFFREEGVFQDATPLEFPFRRRELTGEEAPPPRSMMERRPRNREPRPLNPPVAAEPEAFENFEYPPQYTSEPLRQPPPGPAYAVTLPSRSRMRSAMWIPLSFVFLLFGVALGMMISFGRGPVISRAEGQDFSLGLSVSKSDDNLSVKWDRQAPAIHTATKGVLEIEDGTYTKSVDLDTAQLQNGSIIYRNSSKSVRFRLVVYPKPRVSITETMEWKQ